MAISKSKPVNKKKAEALESAEQESLKWAQDRFNSSWNYSKTQHDRWERNWKLYNNIRTHESYVGVTDTFVPMVYSTVQSLTAALTAGRPSTDFIPQNMWNYAEIMSLTGEKPDLKALNALYDYYWDCDNWDLKTIKTVRAGFTAGTSCEYLYWDIDKPRIINLPVRDLIVDPNLTDPMQLLTSPDTTYAGRRYLATVKDLEAVEIVNPETGELEKRYKNLDKVKPLGGSKGDSDTDKEYKEMLVGATSEDNSDLIEIIEIISGDRMVSMANRSVPIEDRDNVFKSQAKLIGDENPKGLIPIVIHRFIADESLIYGKSIIDPIAKPQELLNDMTNQSVDAVTDALMPQKELDPQYSDWLPKITNAFGAVYPFTPGSLQPIRKDSIPNNAFSERLNIKNEIRETTGVDQVTKGVANDQQATATEIKAQLSQSSQLFELYVRMLEKEGLYQRAKIVFEMIRLFVTSDKSVPTMTQDGPKFFTVKPYVETEEGQRVQVYKDYEPQIRLEASIQAARQRDQSEATKAYQLLIADPTNNLWETKKVLLPKIVDLSEEELDRIIGQTAPVNQGAPIDPGQQPLMPGGEAPTAPVGVV